MIHPYLAYTIGIVLVLAAGEVSLKYYPPGYGYSEERRNNRIGAILAAAGVLIIIATFLLGAKT